MPVCYEPIQILEFITLWPFYVGIGDSPECLMKDLQ